MANIAETPLMLQYLEMKKKHPDAILLFRVGDFYETFSDDAVAASDILGITLTRRANGKAQSVELAGFPHHALDTYLPKLVRAGRRVAICEQLEDPKLTKKLVKRGITEMVTPGVNTSSGALKSRENNFLAAWYATKAGCGVAFLDISTGEFLCSEGSFKDLDRLINSYSPKEMLRMKGSEKLFSENVTWKGSVFELDDWVYTSTAAEDRLKKQFSIPSLKGFGVENMPHAVIAAGSILHYLDLTCHSQSEHITNLRRIDSHKFMHIDGFTLRNLELMQSARDGKSLLDIIDKTANPMGARLLRQWILQPLLDVEEIRWRQQGVKGWFENDGLRLEAQTLAHACGDIYRLCSRVASSKITPRELLRLADCLENAGKLKALMEKSDNKTLQQTATEMKDCSETAKDIASTLDPECSNSFGKTAVIAKGIDAELDDLRRIRDHSQEALEEIQRRETEKTGITSLKVGFNNVFGYYLEVRNTHKDKVPADWIRKQTLVNAERYITPELKEYEEKISNAEEMINAIEGKIYGNLLRRVADKFKELESLAEGVAIADCLLAFATVARDYGYVMPEVEMSTVLDIEEGRHPVIERTLPPGESYIANSLKLDSNRITEEREGCRIMMITGPNMSGKSALLRQTALIALLAQTGSFVPAKKARIGIIDKIFTRVGASDNISSGESTFMTEMNEAAAILNNMTDRSLILFDELGRGTSTYDGISIAWSIVEHIHDNARSAPKTLFATHYHELNEMESKFEGVENYNVSVKEIGGKVVFMRKLEKGGSEHSFGIHVAKLAGMPQSIVKRAQQVLRQLEKDTAQGAKNLPVKGNAKNISAVPDAIQTSFFMLDDPLLSEIRDRLLDLDVNNLTPMQSLNVLNDLKSLLTGKQ